jgi:hypothetical protein
MNAADSASAGLKTAPETNRMAVSPATATQPMANPKYEFLACLRTVIMCMYTMKIANVNIISPTNARVTVDVVGTENNGDKSTTVWGLVRNQEPRAAPTMKPNSCDTMYMLAIHRLMMPRKYTAMVSAGLKWAPEMGPPEYVTDA